MVTAPVATRPPEARTTPLNAPAGGRARWPAGLVVIVGVGVLLRLWHLGGGQLTFDEAFSAVAARLPFSRLITYLQHSDSHPPLDYLMRAPVARVAPSEGWMRLPSALLSVASLVVAAHWWRRLGRVGVLSTALLATSAFAITQAHDARMYAGLGLAGVAAAASAASWLDRPRTAPAVLAAVALLAALFLQGGALLAAPGLLAVPWLRRDREAWRWRGLTGGAVLVWAVVWGPSFLQQARHASDLWVPFTSPSYALGVFNELVDSWPVVKVVAVGLVVAGAIVIPRGTPRRVWWTVGFSSLALPVLVGTHFHVLLPRALAFGAWAPLVALAALVDRAMSRSRVVGAGAGLLVAVLVLPSTVAAAHPVQADQSRAFLAVRAEARSGDEVVTTPAFLWPLPAWYFGVRWDPDGRSVDRPDLQAQGTVIGGGHPSGRVWLIVSTSYRAETGGLPQCAAPQRLGDFVVYCLTGS